MRESHRRRAIDGYLTEPVPQTPSGDHHECQSNRAVDQRGVDQGERDPGEHSIDYSILPHFLVVQPRDHCALLGELTLLSFAVHLVLLPRYIEELDIALQDYPQMVGLFAVGPAKPRALCCKCACSLHFPHTAHTPYHCTELPRRKDATAQQQCTDYPTAWCTCSNGSGQAPHGPAQPRPAPAHPTHLL